MSYPPPPGLNASQPAGSSLPPRPPPPASASSRAHGGISAAAMAFAPRAVASAQTHVSRPAVASAPPAAYGAAPNPAIGPAAPYLQHQHQQHQPQAAPYYPQQAEPYAAPQIRNPFAAPGAGPAGRAYAYDPEMEAQIAQWQSAYSGGSGGGSGGGGSGGPGGGGGGGDRQGNANYTPLGGAPTLSGADVAAAAASGAHSGVASVVTGADGKQKTVVRRGGGETWQDASLLEWDPSHFRIFVGNLAGEVTDDSLLKAFAKFPSVGRARVVRDRRTSKSRGYGFVSFADGDDYFQAAREMQGKYIGSHPVLIKKSTTEIKAVTPKDTKGKGKGRGGRGGGGGGGGGGGDGSGGHNGGAGGGENRQGGAGTGAGVSKKQAKTRGGLKILG